MTGLQQRRADGGDGQMAGSRAFAEILHLGIGAGFFAGLELKAGGVQRVDGHIPAIQAFLLQGVDHVAAE